MSSHSNVKPPEPEKPEKTDITDIPDVPNIEPIKPSGLKRPNFESPLINIVPIVAPGLKLSIDNLVPSSMKIQKIGDDDDR